MSVAGIVVTGNNIIIVQASKIEAGWEVVSDQTIRLPSGDRPAAYHQVYRQCFDILSENGVEKVAMKSSALTTGAMKKAHLESAELRGVVMAASSAAQCKTEIISKAAVSRNFGDRKADEYVADDAFWDDHFEGDLRKGSREASLLILASE